MTLGVWVLVAAAVVAIALGAWRMLTNGVFRGTRRVRRSSRVGGFETGAGRLPQPSVELPQAPSVLAGTTYDGQRGERATLLQFSSAFCAPCRATRRILADVAGIVPGVAHVEVDAEQHLDLVRALGVLRTPTTLVLDADGRELTRATGAPRRAQVVAALEGSLA
ncbi:MAG TPA: thioredoxin family protein [Nocardioides sp.]|nr:thioredoxin family protein [Nocardioides sp.]